jgi:hypothetical protein
MKSINDIPSPESPSFTLPLTLVPPHTHTVKKKLIFRGASQCIPNVGILRFGPFKPYHYSPLPLYLLPPIFNSFQYPSLYLLPSYLMLYSVTDALSFSFPFLEFHRVVPLILICLYMVMFVFVYLFIFGSIFHVGENMQPLSF